MSVLATATHIPRTLIADDQPDVLMALRLLLKGAGYQIEAASSPHGVLEAIKRRKFDLVLIDLNYARDTTSGQEGLDLIASIQAEDNSLPIVVMTAWGTVDLAVEAMRRGVGDFVQKPWDNRRLLQTVEKQIRSGRVLRKRRELRSKKRTQSNNFKRELAEAAEIQRVLLPKRMPQIKGLEISAGWRPAGDLGGDYFDVLQFSEHQIGICVGDVSGKGLPAALLMSNLQATLKTCSSPAVSPAELCRRINEIVCDNTNDCRFITFFYGLIDTEQRTFSFSNAGHNPPFVIRSNGNLLQLDEGGGVLGVLNKQDYNQATIRLERGDRLVFFTDGFTEALNAAGEEFGEGRLRELLIQERQLSAVQLQAKAMETVTEFCAGHFLDDVTMMVLAVE